MSSRFLIFMISDNPLVWVHYDSYSILWPTLTGREQTRFDGICSSAKTMGTQRANEKPVFCLLTNQMPATLG